MDAHTLKHLPKLIRASLEGDKRTVELSSLSIIRRIKKDYPSISNEIAEIIASFAAGAPLTRSLGIEPPPTDKESLLSLVNIEEYSTFEENIILDDNLKIIIERFIKERSVANKLLAVGVKPPNSLLFYGPPGVGKTFLSKYISYKLSLPLITIDLSTSISSYLGKTGKNLKQVLDYAKSNPSVLLLDEFDAIAKRRDDPTDLGELKRIVNVLLKELEEWPNNCIVIGATNHPEFLDKAIWRRFDIKAEIDFPNQQLRYLLWRNQLDKEVINIEDSFLKTISGIVENVSPADIKQISEQVLRQVIVEGGDPHFILISALRERDLGKQQHFNKKLVVELKNYYGRKITQAKIADLLGISTSTVNHHLKSCDKDNK